MLILHANVQDVSTFTKHEDACRLSMNVSSITTPRTRVLAVSAVSGTKRTRLLPTERPHDLSVAGAGNLAG